LRTDFKGEMEDEKKLLPTVWPECRRERERENQDEARSAEVA
jgi:hypothetical protein